MNENNPKQVEIEEIVIQLKGKHRKGWRDHRTLDTSFLDLTTKKDQRWLKTEIGAIKEAFPSSEFRIVKRVSVITEFETFISDLLAVEGEAK